MKNTEVSFLIIFICLSLIFSGCLPYRYPDPSGPNNPKVRLIRSIATGQISIMGMRKDNILKLLGPPDNVGAVNVSMFGKSESWTYHYDSLSPVERSRRDSLAGLVWGDMDGYMNHSPTGAELSIDFKNDTVESFNDDSALNNPKH